MLVFIVVVCVGSECYLAVNVLMLQSIVDFNVGGFQLYLVMMLGTRIWFVGVRGYYVGSKTSV